MNDTYVECLVPCKRNPLAGVLKVILYAIAAGFAFAGLFVKTWAFIPAVVFVVLAYLLIPMLDIEYEYLYLDKEISIDKIISKEKRKHVVTIDLNNMEVLAPINSHELDYYNNSKNIEKKDYTSKEEDRKFYAIVYTDKSVQKMAMIEPNEALLHAVKTVFPRKVLDF